MSRSKSILPTIAIVGVAIAVTLVFIFYFDDIFTSTESAGSTAVHALIPKDAISNNVTKGQSIHFTKGALTCDKLQSIKDYFTYINARGPRRIAGITRLFISGSCRYSTTPKADATVLDIQGTFVKVRWRYNEALSIAWIIHTELFE